MAVPEPEVLCDGVTLYEGDCLDVLPTLDDGSVQATITDPPFSERTHKGHDASASGHAGRGKDNADRSALGYQAWSVEDVNRVVPELHRATDGWIVVMNDHILSLPIADALERAGRYVFAPLPFYSPGSRVRLSGDGPSSWTIWITVARTAKEHRWGTLPGGYMAGEGWRDREHMGGKPLKLMRALVRDYSRLGDTILDPYAGSGTTAVAAIREGRKCVLVERNPVSCDIIRKRVREAAGVGSLFDGVA